VVRAAMAGALSCITTGGVFSGSSKWQLREILLCHYMYAVVTDPLALEREKIVVLICKSGVVKKVVYVT